MRTYPAAATTATAAAFVSLLIGLAQPGTGGAAAPRLDAPPLPPLPAPLNSLLGSGSSASETTPAAASSSPSGAGPQSATTARYAPALQRSMVAEINVVRRSFGRSRLTLTTQLVRAGQQHAHELALHGLFSHDWSDGSPFSRWIQRFYPAGRARVWAAGENLAWSTPDLSAGHAIELWLASPSRRRILLDKRWRQVGIGVVQADNAGGVYLGENVVIVAGEFGLRR
jgi:uncharacterized protein YkwD